MEVFLVVGLGNPGAKYARTRHNAGFDVVEILASQMRVRLSKLRHRARIGEGVFENKKVVLAQPQTFMNLSGDSVSLLLKWYKPSLSNVIVVYDDIDLPPGTVRVRPSGSSGTHNGMRSVIGAIGGTDFPRVRVGIGGPPLLFELADWVVSHYETEQARKVAFDSLVEAADAVSMIIREGVEASMRAFNKKTRVDKGEVLPVEITKERKRALPVDATMICQDAPPEKA